MSEQAAAAASIPGVAATMSRFQFSPPVPLPRPPPKLSLCMTNQTSDSVSLFTSAVFVPARAATRKKTDEGGIDILIARVNLLHRINRPDSPSQDYCSYTYGDDRVAQKNKGTKEAWQCTYGYAAEMHFTTLNVEEKENKTTVLTVSSPHLVSLTHSNVPQTHTRTHTRYSRRSTNTHFTHISSFFFLNIIFKYFNVAARSLTAVARAEG